MAAGKPKINTVNTDHWWMSAKRWFRFRQVLHWLYIGHHCQMESIWWHGEGEYITGHSTLIQLGWEKWLRKGGTFLYRLSTDGWAERRKEVAHLRQYHLTNTKYWPLSRSFAEISCVSGPAIHCYAIVRYHDNTSG